MSEEQEIVDQEVNAEEAEKQAAEESAADFAEGFNSVRGDEPPAEEPSKEVAAESNESHSAETGESEEGGEQADPNDEEFYQGMSKSQVMKLLAKAAEVDRISADFDTERRKLYGKIGELNSNLLSIQQQSKGTQSGGEAGVNNITLKRLQDEYPDVAEMLAEDLRELHLQSGGASQEQVGELVQQTLNNALAAQEEREQIKLEGRLLSLMHPDWRDVAQSDDFKLWKSRQSEEDQYWLDSSNDANYLSYHLTRFKNDIESIRQKPSNNKQQRLEAAVTPSGVPATQSTTDHDAFLAGFKAVRG